MASAGTFALELPASLEEERTAYEADVAEAADAVATWFEGWGFSLPADGIVRRAIVFDERGRARRALAEAFGTDLSAVPETTSGTVSGSTLYLVSRAIYRETWGTLYPSFPWTDATYRSLIAHELAHRVHAAWCLARFGTEDGMGPRWFFEGLAVACAGQFAPPADFAGAGDLEPFLGWEEIRAGARADAPVSYPSYGRMVRSLLASYPALFLAERAFDPAFPEPLGPGYLPSRFVLEGPSGRQSRGSILLVHGSAPFDASGRIPGAPPDARYARDPFFRDLARWLCDAGWVVLRYAKPGCEGERVDPARYAATDLALIERQIGNLWRFLPAARPRVALAWSEGSLHLGGVLGAGCDAVILLGGIATNIGDVVAAQGGPPRAALAASLAALDRRAMLGTDRPAGRLADELRLPDNRERFAVRPDLPLLVLHGTADCEVPAAQAQAWLDRPPGPRLTVVRGEGLDHRFMPPGRYDPSRPARAAIEWLDRVFPGA